MRLLRKLFGPKLRKSEKGQAMAEYQVLFPGSILLAGFMLPVLAAAIDQIYCDVANTFNPGVCASVQAEQEEDEGQGEQEEEACVVTLQEEQGGSQCDQSEDCSLLPGANSAEYTASQEIKSFVIKAGVEYHLYQSGVTDDGCYFVEISGNSVSWSKTGGGRDCKDISHTQAWYVTVCKEE